PPQYIANNSKVVDTLVNEGCVIYGELSRSVIFPGVYVGEGAEVKHSVIMPGAKIQPGARVYKSIVGSNAVIGENSQIGVLDSAKTLEEIPLTVIGDGEHISPNSTVLEARRV
ncbi:MAG: glucose-1-phosphate adenylyltransferase, partial [Bacillota bacterium]